MIDNKSFGSGIFVYGFKSIPALQTVIDFRWVEVKKHDGVAASAGASF